MTAWLADTLVATSLLMALVLLVREPVRRQFGPAVAYGLWLIPALRAGMPPLTWTVERTVSSSPGLAHPAQPSFMLATEPSLIEQLGGWEALVVSAWLAGAAAMLLCGLLRYRQQRREVLRDSIHVARLGDIRVVRSKAVRGPMAFGIFDRVIALPIDFDERFEPHERRLALDHELSHHRSGDVVVNHLAFVLLCLQWFNPLAWVSHSAFRFDQEAACDARVLDRIGSQDRAAYARAVAKAASGRALLFAGALDRPGTLHRRLRAMLARPGSGLRIAGKALIALAVAAALPLTASRATVYIDVPGDAPLSSAAPAAPATSVQEHADGTVSLPGGVKLGKGSTAFFANDEVLINGKVKRLEQLTSAERSELRATILRSQRDLARERADLPGELAELRQEADRARSGELRRALMRDRADLRRDLAEIDTEADELRASGEDPEKLKAEIRESLREAEAIDIDRQVREAIESADPDRIVAQLRAEEEQMARMLARLDELDRR